MRAKITLQQASSMVSMPRAMVLAMLVAAVGCSSAQVDDAVSTDDSDITSLPRTANEDQKETGNCWLYSTTTWAESLATPSGGAAPRYSTAYLVYWNFYDQILASASGFKGVEWTGGEWDGGVSLITRYGLLPYSAVTSKTSAGADATLSLAALDAVNKSLKSGALKTRASRRDRALVRHTLNQAFGFSASVVADLDATFGADGATTFVNGAVASGRVLAPSAVPARLPTGSTSSLGAVLASSVTTELDPKTPASKHDAAFETFVRRIQRSLHAGIPVPVQWCVEWTGQNKAGVFDTAISGVQEADCAHQTVIVDYEATLADGTVLKAGTPATKAQMTAALAAGARVTFLRMKNSWGADAGSTNDDGNGYTDVYVDYLKSSIHTCPGNTITSSCETWPFLLDTVVLPQGY